MKKTLINIANKIVKEDFMQYTDGAKIDNICDALTIIIMESKHAQELESDKIYDYLKTLIK